MHDLTKLWRREWLQAVRHPAELLNPLVFFALIAVLFPLSTNAQPTTLQAMGAGVIWVAALLANLLSFARIFNRDLSSGCLHHYALSKTPLSWLVSVKVIIHWLLFAAPLMLIAPVVAFAYGLTVGQIKVLFLGLLLGTPSLALLGAMMSALTLGVRNSSVLLALVLFPLYIPILIFGAGSVAAISVQLTVVPQMALMLAIVLLCALCCPPVCARLIRMKLEYS